MPFPSLNPHLNNIRSFSTGNAWVRTNNGLARVPDTTVPYSNGVMGNRQVSGVGYHVPPEVLQGGRAIPSIEDGTIYQPGRGTYAEGFVPGNSRSVGAFRTPEQRRSEKRAWKAADVAFAATKAKAPTVPVTIHDSRR